MSGFGSLLLPHPPVVNWLLRRGLSVEGQYELSFRHEFGHLQSIPAAFLYAAALLAAGILEGHATPLTIVSLLVSVQAAWEMMSELLAVFADTRSYRHYYEGVSMLPRIIFWFLALSFTVMVWLIAFA